MDKRKSAIMSGRGTTPDGSKAERRKTYRGMLTYKTEGDRKTTWITEYLIKRDEDIDLIREYMPVPAARSRPRGPPLRRGRRRTASCAASSGATRPAAGSTPPA